LLKVINKPNKCTDVIFNNEPIVVVSHTQDDYIFFSNYTCISISITSIHVDIY